MLTEFSAAGVAVVDEVVACTTAVVINSVTYYRGFLENSVNQNIAGSDSATYGVWTAASKGGTRKTVLLSVLPSASTDVMIDTQTGAIYSTASVTVYVCYLAHMPQWLNAIGQAILSKLWVGPDGGGAGRELRINSGVAGTYMRFYTAADGGLNFAATGSGQFTWTFPYALDFIAAHRILNKTGAGNDYLISAGGLVKIQDRDASDADRVTFNTTNGDTVISGALTAGGAKDWGKLATAPSSGHAEGDRYYDTALHKQYVYDGTTWQACW